MKRHLLLSFVFLFTLSFASAQTINWQTGSGDPCAGTGNGTANATSDAACITIVSLCRGAGINSASGGDFNSNGFDTSNASCADAIADDDCLTWGFDLAAGCTIPTGSTMEFQLDRSSTGPPNYCLDMDDGTGFASLGTGAISASTGCVNVSTTADIVGPTTVTFRLCAWGASSGAGTMDIEDGIASCGGAADGGILFTAAVVPVEFGTIQARTNDRTIDLTWDTHSEINNERFEIYWSNDGSNFSVIGSQEGSGNTTSRNTYSFTHDSPVSGQNFYKIKQIDYDGSYAYSTVVTARVEKEINEIALTPSPVRDALYISSNEEIVSLEIYSLSGALVMNQTNVTDNVVDVSTLQQGVYVVRMKTNQNTIAKKIIKQ